MDLGGISTSAAILVAFGIIQDRSFKEPEENHVGYCRKDGIEKDTCIKLKVFFKGVSDIQFFCIGISDADNYLKSDQHGVCRHKNCTKKHIFEEPEKPKKAASHGTFTKIKNDIFTEVKVALKNFRRYGFKDPQGNPIEKNYHFKLLEDLVKEHEKDKSSVLDINSALGKNSVMSGYDYCRICEKESIANCRCLRSDRICVNGHSWHKCTEHNERVEGSSDHSASGCSCKTHGRATEG